MVVVARRSVTIPESITKNGREHKLPYGDLILPIFDNVPHLNRTDLLFPSRVSDEYPISSWSKYKREFADGVPGWRLHDLRRTYRAAHARIGTPPYIGERLINHISGVTSDVEEIYDVWTLSSYLQGANREAKSRFPRIDHPSTNSPARFHIEN